jgi:hypothetical protein
MLRKVVSAAVVMVLCVGVTLAEEIRGLITKVEGDKVTFTEMKGFGKNAEKGETKTLPVAKDVKVVKGKFNPDTKAIESGEAIEGGLKNKMFTEIGEKGVFATIVTDKDNKHITEIRAFGGRGGKGGKDK